jgi:ribosomal protein S18 acetylase RimI-like enzyme
MQYRKAKVEDIKRLVEIENLSFNYDQLNARQFRYFIQKGHCDLIVQIKDNQISGYGLLFYRKNSRLSRIYSIAIHQDFHGQGCGKVLMLALESFTLKKGRNTMRLEVKVTNHKAINLYKKIGYIQFSTKQGYYDDNEDALCLEKKLSGE